MILFFILYFFNTFDEIIYFEAILRITNMINELINRCDNQNFNQYNTKYHKVNRKTYTEHNGGPKEDFELFANIESGCINE